MSSQFLRHLIVRLSVSVLFIVGANSAADEPSAIQLQWQGSPHAAETSDSFRHWDKEGEIPSECATCHSMTGFLDYTGEDGSAAGVVDSASPTGTVVGCTTCHHNAIEKQDSITFPSGALVTGAGASTPCLICHQGRLSTPQVNEKLNALAPDVPVPELSFLNVHYRAAAASLYGSEVNGGYEYADKQYAGKFMHPEPLDTCTGCHNPHDLTLRDEQCSTCHTGVENLSDIRLGSADFDGNDDTDRGVATELANLHTLLGNALAVYAAQISVKPIVYSPASYPYFFNDLNDNKKADAEESVYPNRYQSWTPRLVRAAYNYQFVAKDPGIWAHNPRYAAQLMIDSLEDLGLSVELDLPDLNRP